MPNPDNYRIEIKPVPHFIPDQSSPDDDRYVFALSLIHISEPTRPY